MKKAFPAAVAAAAFLAFLPALGAGFVDFDDDVNFTNNPHYRGFSGPTLAWMLTTAEGHYIPVTWLTLALDYELWGMDARGYHFTSLAFHAANAALFYAVLVLLLRRLGTDEATLRWSAAAGALLFAIHPLRAESVAWVTERRDVVSGLFFLLSVWAYLRAAEPEARRLRWLTLSVAAFALSLLSKTMGMGLPFVLLILDRWVLRRRAPLEKIPYFALFLAAVVVTYATQKRVDTLVGVSGYSLAHRVFQPPFRVLFYVAKTLFPVGLSPIYFWDPDTAAVQPFFLVCAAILAGVTFALWRIRARHPGPLAAWLAFGFLIAPVCGVFQAGPHFAADRYTYLALLPAAALAAVALRRVPLRSATAAASAAVLALLGALAFAQSAIWTSSAALWEHAVAVRPDDPLALNNRGAARAAAKDLKGALADFEKCLARFPRYAHAFANRGRVKVLSGDAPGALRDFDQAVLLDPKLVHLAEYRGMARMQMGDSAGARDEFDEAVRRAPARAELRYLRGAMRHKLDDFDGALADYSEAVRLRPALVEAWYNRGLLHQRRGNLEAAIADFGECMRLNPADLGAVMNRGTARRTRGDLDGAEADFLRALESARGDSREAIQRELDAVRRARGR